MTDTIDLSKLKEPFKEDEYEWRLNGSGKSGNGDVWAKVVCYVQNRAIMNRLDDVCGAGNWQNVLSPIPGGMSCGISIKVGNEWVTKYDGAQTTDIEAVKGGISNAMKRAAVQWGIGRLLYNLEATWANVSISKINGWTWASANQKKGIPAFHWETPTLPDWAVSGRSGNSGTPKPTAKPVSPKPNSKKTSLKSEFWGYFLARAEEQGTKLPKAKDDQGVPIPTSIAIIEACIDDMGSDQKSKDICENLEGLTFPLTSKMDINSKGWDVLSSVVSSFDLKKSYNRAVLAVGNVIK